MEKEKEFFIQSLEELGLKITSEQLEQFMKFYRLLVEKNKVMNLTGITDLHEVIVKHFIDSLSIVKIQNMNSVNNMIDMGTGAGFPGIPIKIMFPHIQVVLMDSLNKRIKFLEEASLICGLDNISFIHGRAEELGKNVEYREKFDLCVSRAVANLSTLSEYCIPFVSVKGNFICYKSGNSDEEIKNAMNAINILSSKIDDRKDFVLPGSDFNRTLLKINKIKSISKIYPRKAGIPSKNPLS